jgi:gliding motility-associated lipoprotein GldD
MRIAYFVLLFSLFFVGCQEVPPSPKPRAYPKILFPAKEYQKFDEDYCNFSFEYPTYAQIIQDTNFFEKAPIHPCWFDLYIPAFDCRLHCSYYPIGQGKTFDQLKRDAFELVNWHNKRANYIDELPIHKNNGVSGMAFDIDGPAASPFQFYLTDSTQHFMRAALYFNTQIEPDSLAPAYKFVKEDIVKLIETFSWNK